MFRRPVEPLKTIDRSSCSWCTCPSQVSPQASPVLRASAQICRLGHTHACLTQSLPSSLASSSSWLTAVCIPSPMILLWAKISNDVIAAGTTTITGKMQCQDWILSPQGLRGFEYQCQGRIGPLTGSRSSI